MGQNREKIKVLETVSNFDRIGEKNAFAVLAKATALAQNGMNVINLGIGQPDFQTPQHIVEAAVKALKRWGCSDRRTRFWCFR